MTLKEKIITIAGQRAIMNGEDREWLARALLQAFDEALEQVLGPDMPLEPTPDAVGQPGIDPKKWHEWSTVENNLLEAQRARKATLLGEEGKEE